eukprot:scaffold20267_cov114-Isochrysis_galbana.AAC.1
MSGSISGSPLTGERLHHVFHVHVANVCISLSNADEHNRFSGGEDQGKSRANLRGGRTGGRTGGRSRRMGGH